MSKKVVVTGVTGQDGSYMVDHLLATTDYEIYGVVRRLSVPNHENIAHVSDPRFRLVTADVTDATAISNLVRDVNPDYFINFAANSFVGNSWEMPFNHIETNFLAVLYQLEAIKNHAPGCRYYQAGSSEEWGDVDYSPQDEKHPMKPRSPYGVSKCASRLLVKVYRESYGLFAIQGQLLNHESCRRGAEFLPMKISKGVARVQKEIHLGSVTPIEIGNPSAKRDWSHAKDFVRGIWLMLNQTEPKELVLASNETHSVRELVEIAFRRAGLRGKWVGQGMEETFQVGGIVVLKINEKFFRPAEVDLLWGDSTRARTELGWEPEYSFENLINEMVDDAIVKS